MIDFWIEEERKFKKVFFEFLYWTAHIVKRKFTKSFPVNASSYSNEEIRDMIKRTGFEYVKNIKGFYLIRKR